jgi:hypothetical protein
MNAFREGAPARPPTGFEPVGKAIGTPKQDALLPAIALISLGFAIPPRSTPFPGVPPQATLEGHTGGTGRSKGEIRSWTKVA